MTDLKKGDKITIPGCGWGSKGQEVFNNFNPKTKRKCKAVKLRTYVIGQTFNSSNLILPPIAPDSDSAAIE